ncbi:MAG: hypothetical protein J6V99_03095 [Neisseriaceae bacterium]|nr:hypothetical protein [Neisseriaceae bacterium]
MNTTVSGSLKKGLISIAPLYVALMGVFFVPTVWGAEIDKPCQYDDTTNSIECGTGNKVTANLGSITAIGLTNTVSAMQAVAVGRENTASGGWSSAIGNKNTASENGAVAVGYGNTAQQANSVAVGVENVANNGTTTAVGFQNKANGLESSALGYGNITNDHYEVAVGYKNITNGARSTAVGNENQATALWSSAVGGGNTTSGTYSSAVGFKNNVSGGYASAFGAFNSATADYSIALGSSSNAYRAAGDVGYSPVGKTYDTDTTGVWKSNRGVVAVGDSKNENAAITRQITGVAAGKYDTDAVNVAQLKEVQSLVGTCSYDSDKGALQCGDSTASGKYSSAVGYRSQALSENSHAFGGQNNYSGSGISSVTMGTGAVALGYQNNYKSTGAVTVGHESTAVGVYNTASGQYSSAMGYSNTASGDWSSALGYRNTASGKSSALGNWNTASGNWSSAMGRANTASGIASSAMGYRNIASGEDSSAVGGYNTASANWSSAVGYENLASGIRSSAMGFSNTASGNASSAVGNKNTANKLYSSALGAYNTAEVDFGTAVGFGSLANRDSGTQGVYTPANFDSLDAKGKAAWQATSAALAVGNPDNTNLSYYNPNTRSWGEITTPITRQITGVAAGSEDTDAVNVAQLKEVAGMVGSGGSFSPITVSDGGSGSFTVGSAGSLKMVGSNANLSTNANGDTVTIALADNLNLTSVTADKVSVGSLTVNKDGKISGVAAGAAEKDAVNFGQLNALQKTVDNLQDTVNNLPTASGSGNATPLTVAAGDDNVQVAMNANKTRATVSLKDEISLNKITTGSASLSANGLNNGGNVISNVKAGSADLEAVNVKQLKDANAANLKASVQAVKGDNKNRHK